MADNQPVEDQQTIPFGGINQLTIPEASPEAVFVQGLVPDRVGELVKFPGKNRYFRLGILPIRGIYEFGDQIFVENAQQLVRFSNAEIFGGTETAPDLQPDIYLETLTEEEEKMAIAILKYRVASGTAGSAIAASTYTNVPFTNEDADSGGNVVLAGDGSFTLSNAVYPVNVRIEAQVCFRSLNAAAATAAQLYFETTAGVFVAAGMNAVSFGSGTVTEMSTCHILARFALAASTAYRLRIRTTQATIFGTAITSGAQEVYAQCKLLFEPTTVPIADGVILAANYGVSITTEGGLITATA